MLLPDLEVWQAELVFSVYREFTSTPHLLLPAPVLGTCLLELHHPASLSQWGISVGSRILLTDTHGYVGVDMMLLLW